MSGPTVSGAAEPAPWWAASEAAQESASLSLIRGPAGWRLTASIGCSDVHTGNAIPTPEIRRLLRNLLPELFSECGCQAHSEPPASGSQQDR